MNKVVALQICKRLAEQGNEEAKILYEENKPQYSKKDIIKILKGFDNEICEYENGDDESYLYFINKYK